MLTTKANSPVAWWNKPVSKWSKVAFILIIFGGLILYEALVPRPFLFSHDWRYLLAFVLFSAGGGIGFGCLITMAAWAKRITSLPLQVCTVLLSILGMVWITAFTDYKRINTSFDSYTSAVFGGFLIGILNARSLKAQPRAE